MTPVTVGSVAPDFTLDTTSGAKVTLSDFRGKTNVLIAFFPMAFTSVCTTELCAFSEEFDAFAAKDVTVLPISVDMIPSLKEFKTKFGMQAELASDMRREVSRAYGTLIEEKWFSNRAYFLVDKAGVVRWAHVEANPGQRRENAEILSAIAALN